MSAYIPPHNRPLTQGIPTHTPAANWLKTQSADDVWYDTDFLQYECSRRFMPPPNIKQRNGQSPFRFGGILRCHNPSLTKDNSAAIKRGLDKPRQTVQVIVIDYRQHHIYMHVAEKWESQLKTLKEQASPADVEWILMSTRATKGCILVHTPSDSSQPREYLLVKRRFHPSFSQLFHSLQYSWMQQPEFKDALIDDLNKLTAEEQDYLLRHTVDELYNDQSIPRSWHHSFPYMNRENVQGNLAYMQTLAASATAAQSTEIWMLPKGNRTYEDYLWEQDRPDTAKRCPEIHTACRETSEETGLDIDVIQAAVNPNTLIPTTQIHKRGGHNWYHEQYYMLAKFNRTADNDDKQLVGNPETTARRWFTLAEIVLLGDDTLSKTMAKVDKIMSQL